MHGGEDIQGHLLGWEKMPFSHLEAPWKVGVGPVF